jgi:hypothetical protein
MWMSEVTGAPGRGWRLGAESAVLFVDADAPDAP